MNIPDILTADTWFWSPSGSASGRRANEKRRGEEVSRFIDENKTALSKAGIAIDFSYSETCTRVYKRCAILRDGQRSNITAVRKALAQMPEPVESKPEETKLPSSQAAYQACASVIRERQKVKT